MTIVATRAATDEKVGARLNVLLRACDGTTRKATHWYNNGVWCCDWFKGGMGK